MSAPITQHLNEQLRDAMLAFYMNTVLPEDPTVQTLQLADTFKHVDDIYAYWLLDPQVSHAVPTTRIASAIASLQQYINAIYLGLERGYEETGMSHAQQTEWRDTLLTYSLWRANQQLCHYPASYLSPTLRHDKSDSFRQLEDELNQFRTEPASLLKAVHGYLNRFEELANIRTLNGYIDGDRDSFASSAYYFIGKSSSENTYYWRTLAMPERPAEGTAPKPAVWSGWKKIHLSIDDNVPEQTIRPVVFNGRLFLVWAQCINPMSSTKDITPFGRGDVESDKEYQQRLDTRIQSTYLQFRLYFSFKKLDDSWSTPQLCIQEYNIAKELDELSSEDLMSATHTIAVVDANPLTPSLFLGLLAQPNTPAPAQNNATHRNFYQAIRVDEHFNTHWLESIGSTRKTRLWLDESHLELAGRYLAMFTHHNHARFQFRATKTAQVNVEALTLDAPHGAVNGWNYEGHQNKIRALTSADIKFNTTTSILEVTTRLAEGFEPHHTLIFNYDNDLVTFTLTLSTNGVPQANETLKLSATSQIHLKSAVLIELSSVQIGLSLKCQKTGVEQADFIRNESNQPFSLALPPKENASPPTDSVTLDLDGTYISREAFEYFSDAPDSAYLVSLTFHEDHGSPPDHKHDLFHGTVTLNQKQRLYRPVLMYMKQANAALPETLNRNNTVLVGQAEHSRRNLRDAFTELSIKHFFDVPIEFAPQTMRPYGEETGNPPPASLTLIHGVLILESDVRYPSPTILGYALKTATFRLGTHSNPPVIPLAPRIRRLTSAPYGTAEFIDFDGSAIDFDSSAIDFDSSAIDFDSSAIDFDGSAIEYGVTPKHKRAPIRTNTCVASLLTKTAGADVHHLFSLPTDAWREPPLAGEKNYSLLDFQGAHGAYYWELFLYLPWLLAHRLNLEQQYADAEVWIRFLFDPAHQSAHWRQPMLLADTAPPPSQTLLCAHRLAKSSPVHFRQALYLLYVDILLNRGDAAYRQMSRDSLAEAKLWYIRTKGLLGPRPPLNAVDPWVTTTLDKLQSPSALGRTPVPAGTARLCRSLSPDLLMRWDKVEARLYNLRHHLDLTGKPMSLPLYAATLTPQALLAAYQQGTDGASVQTTLRTAHAGHYRFQVVLGHALQAVDNLIQLGATLLSLWERKEQAHFVESQQQQAWELARLAVEQQAQAVQVDTINRHALLAGRRIVEARVAFIEQQLKVGISPAEAQATQAYQDSAHWETAAAVAQAGAGLAMLIPNIFGTSNGGVRYEGAFHALQAMSQGMANEQRANAAHLDRSDLFARRAAEWGNALEQARLELAQVDAQLLAYTEQEQHTRLQLRLAQTAFTQARTLYDLLGKRFTNAQLYQWLNGQLATFYYQAYDATLSLCLAAEACWQEERAEWNKHFIQTGLWVRQYRGLSAGEALKQNLLSMSSAYTTQNERLLEITKTVSLGLLHDQDASATGDKPWATLKAELLTNGTLSFELTRKLFDDDYPGHYLRRIKSVSVSLPATLGPYEDIKAILTQTGNTTHLAPTSDKPEVAAKKDWRARQEIALSNGLNDSGLFTLNFDGDERYLPFEYTGAISTWQLSFPNHKRQEALLKSLTDIIVHLRYTARNSGGLR
ncbi:insecticidal toxin complex protein TcaB1 [Pseudomonas synxantha BG33R]|uniref:Tc toxin subunit A-related protein n=1 Tax=Pseudomonas synxantha TaxID=47883 RepID=UPI00025FDCC2|nr:neuraminidase-like domain-containing protein [Pseudomonas synxantha]EIK72680.1 insecticidal toxin complex protein TcaB1 [Pseudomonas synxantha BG33R]